MRATMRSWFDSGLLPVKVLKGAVLAGTVLSAAVMVPSATMERRVMALYSFSRIWLLGAWVMLRMASRTALEP